MTIHDTPVPYVNTKHTDSKKHDCGHGYQSDQVAALNYARRYGDHGIGLYVPCSQVKTILFSRFHRRLEAGQPVTVPGRTLDTATEMCPPLSRDRNITAGREKILVHRAVNQRAKQNKYI